MRGYFAVTDPTWWERLLATAGPKDANFWRPSVRAVRLETGTPFFFKLKAPANAIAGFGFFAGFSVLPDWLAWETFREANGVESLAALRTRLSNIQHGARIRSDEAGRIGCCLVAESHFFPREEWIKTPSDWSPRTQTGAGYDLSTGEGRRVWDECRARLLGAHPPAPGLMMVAEASTRYGPPSLHVPRLGQSIFRVQVLDAYERACAVTNEHSLPVLDAAHIRPYALGGEHAVSNGLSLRADLHRLFDRGYLTVDEDLRLVVGRRLRADFENGKTYYGLAGSSLTLPTIAACRPDRAALAWHRENAFLG